MGGRGSGSGSGGGIGVKPASLADGEKPALTVRSGPGGKDERVLVTEKDGRYQYKGNIPDPGRVDKDSADYKSALRSYNVKAQVHSDGTVTVSKGGLYDRKRTFKSEEAFQKDANKRLDAEVAYYERSAATRRQGYMSQLQVENARSNFRDQTPSDAHRSVQASIRGGIAAAEARAEAAREMKRRLATANR